MMTTQEQYIAKIKQLVVEKYGRSISSADDCAALSDAVEKSVGVRIDMPTLQMLFSRSKPTVPPRLMVLTTLAKYVGYEDWSGFCASNRVDTSDDDVRIPIRRRWGVITATVVGVMVILLGALFLLNDDEAAAPSSTPAPTVYDLVVDKVTDKYIALVDEECIALRIYDGVNRQTLEEETQAAIERYKSDVSLSIAEDIRAAAAQEGIEVDDVSVTASADDITDKCVAILHELLEE